jgi:hypothetical protein
VRLRGRLVNWLMTRAPLLFSPFMWRTVWRFYIWLVCDCRRGGLVSWSGDGSGGWLCDSCGRHRESERLDVVDFAEQALGVPLMPWQRAVIRRIAAGERWYLVGGRRVGRSTLFGAALTAEYHAEVAAWLASPIRAAEPPALAERVTP